MISVGIAKLKLQYHGSAVQHVQYAMQDKRTAIQIYALPPCPQVFGITNL